MLRPITRHALAVLAVALAVSACDDTTTPTSPTDPTIVTDTFRGTVAQNGAATHPFKTAAAGAVKATLKTIGTDNTLVVGFALGTLVSDACHVVLANDAATGDAVLTGTMTGAGDLCVRIYDVGNVPAGAPAAYTVEVSHP
jgi:hypothetical protein